VKTIIDSFRLDGKTALVTGSTSGLGFNMAMALAQAGAQVCINGRDEERLKNAVQSFRSSGIHVFPVKFDVSNETDVAQAVSTIETNVGTVDILINNAGIIKRIPVLDMTVEDFKQVLDINLVSSLIVAKHVVPQMIAKGGGKIVNICSMMSFLGRNSVSAYAAAKGGLQMLTKNMCCEWAKHNIQVNGLAPGYIKTVLTSDFTQQEHPFNRLVMMRTPAGRWGLPEDMMGTAVFLASEASNFINGQIICVDGGIMANFGYMEGENSL